MVRATEQGAAAARSRGATRSRPSAEGGAVLLHHLLDDSQVPRDAERGVFPGVSRDAVRRCADVVVGVVDDVRAAS